MRTSDRPEYICDGELASLYYALDFLGDNLKASREHVKALQDMLVSQRVKQAGGSAYEALVCFAEWRHSGGSYTHNERGAGRKRFKLTEEDVIAIRKAKAEGQKLKDIASKYGITIRYVSKL